MRGPSGQPPSTLRDAARRELIGLPVTVIVSNDPGLVGLEGTVVDETRNTFVIERPDGREVRVGKSGQDFRFLFPEGEAVLQGVSLRFPPEDRIKRMK